MDNRSQAVVPQGVPVQNAGDVHKERGERGCVSPRPFDWTSYFAEGPVASAREVEDYRCRSVICNVARHVEVGCDIGLSHIGVQPIRHLTCIRIAVGQELCLWAGTVTPS